MRLRERLPVLWQEPTQVRIGTDPRWSVVLTDLSPGAVRALTTARPGASERSLRAALRREGASPTETEDVVAHLRATHLLVDDPPRERADAAVLGLLESVGCAVDVLARRTAARVRVCGLGRLGAALVTTLASAGVGRIDLDDAAPVGRHDVGWAGYTSDDVGRPRTTALATAVRRAGDGAQLRVSRDGPVDLVVLVEQHVADPTRHRPLMTDGTPHLSVVVREASVLVGPLVEPGRTPCLRCLDLHRTDLDPHWPAVAAQLAVQRPGPEDTVLAAVGASLAAAQVVAFLDGRTSAVAGAAIEVRLPEALPRLVSWDLHPECGCAGL